MGSSKTIGRIFGDLGLGLLALLAGGALFFFVQSAVGGAANDATIEPLVLLDTPEAGPGAVSPRLAVQAFLDAEVGRDATAAFDLLSSDDRRRLRSPQQWASRAPLGEIIAWEWTDDETLVTLISLEGSLSLTRGWSPAATAVTWSVVDEDGWRIVLDQTISEPDHLDPGEAVAAATAWLQNPARCDTASGAALAPSSSTHQRLCTTGGVVEVNLSQPVSGDIAAQLSLAYGPDAPTWARTVPLEGGVSLILAEVDGRWLVIDAAAS